MKLWPPNRRGINLQPKGYTVIRAISGYIMTDKFRKSSGAMLLRVERTSQEHQVKPIYYARGDEAYCPLAE